VSELDLRPGGQLVYTMTATAPEQVEFMENAGMPPTRLAYLSLIDFVPDHEPYEHPTVIEIRPAGEGTHVTTTVDPMHGETWTQRILAGRRSELHNLRAAIDRRA
jgi:hypothetical protein